MFSNPMLAGMRDLLVRTGTAVETLARYGVFAGALALVLIALITLASIVGRAFIPLGLRPLAGQVELVEAGMVFAVCAFLPWAHLKRGHASVAIFTGLLGFRANRVIDFLTDFLLLTLACLLTWRHFHGLVDKMTFGETTFLLGLPLWWVYGGAMFGLVIWIIVGLWASLNSARLMFSAPVARLEGTVRRGGGRNGDGAAP